MAERVDDLVIGIAGDFDDTAFRKAISAVEELDKKTGKSFDSSKKKSESLKKTYSNFSKDLTMESKSVSSAAKKVQSAIDKMDNARRAYEDKQRTWASKRTQRQIAGGSRYSAEIEYETWKADLLSQKVDGKNKYKLDEGIILKRNEKGDYEADIRKTATLEKKLVSFTNAQKREAEAIKAVSKAQGDATQARNEYAKAVQAVGLAIKNTASAEIEYHNQLKEKQAAKELAEQEKLRIAQEKQATKESLQAEKQAAKEKQALIKQIEASEARLLKEQEAQQKKRNAVIKSASNQAVGLIQKAYRKIKSINFGQIIAKVYSFVTVVKQLNSFIEASSEWIENLNLLEVVYNDTADSAENIKNRISELSKQFRLDVNALAKYVSVFKQMANAMGQTAEVGTQMSEVLSLIALDVSSLRNVSTEQAVSDLTGALAGQVKPVRKYGFDITMYSIEELMREVGFSGNARTMSQSNKQLARAILLVRQSKDAWGDLSKTINTYANQQRILNDQITQFKRLLGNVLLGSFKVTDTFEEAEKTAGILQKGIWYLNGALIATNTILEAMIPSAESFNGAIASGAEEAIDALEEEEEALNGTLASFDKFNALQSNDSSNNSASAALEALFGKESAAYMEEFESRLAAINMYAEEIAETILFILYPDFEAWSKANENGTFKEWSEQSEEFKNKTEELKETLYGMIQILAWAANPLLGIFTTIGMEMLEMGSDERIARIKELATTIETVSSALTTVVGVLSDVFETLGPLLIRLLDFIAVCASSPASLWTLVAAIVAIAVAVIAVKAAIENATTAPLKVAAYAIWTAALLGTISSDIGKNAQAHKDGGFQTGGFFFAGEGGPEWVGRQGNTATILNDNQMSDIMMDSVAKGVVKANMATRQMGGAQKSGGKVAVVNINGKHLFDVVEQEGYKEGKIFAKSK